MSGELRRLWVRGFRLDATAQMLHALWITHSYYCYLDFECSVVDLGFAA